MPWKKRKVKGYKVNGGGWREAKTTVEREGGQKGLWPSDLEWTSEKSPRWSVALNPLQIWGNNITGIRTRHDFHTHPHQLSYHTYSLISYIWTSKQVINPPFLFSTLLASSPLLFNYSLQESQDPCLTDIRMGAPYALRTFVTAFCLDPFSYRGESYMKVLFAFSCHTHIS